MNTRARIARRSAVQPSLDGLEARELMSSVPAHVAEIAALSATHRPTVSTIGQLATTLSHTVSTVPANGDVNPYGVAFVPADFARGGVLHPGDVLVSNFNNSQNLQGTGTTIVRITPDGQRSVFFQGPQGVGLSTALGVLKKGYVLVGNLPSTDGTSATAGQGSLLVLDKNGRIVADFANAALLNGPWDLTIHDNGNRAQIYVSNVLSGTVSRFDVSLSARGGFHLVSATQIASGYAHRGDPAAFELGPTGLAYDARHDTLYVASTADNAIFAIHHAGTTRGDGGTGPIAYRDNARLHGPLGLTFAPDGNLIVANGDAVNADPHQPNELVEFTPHGQFIGQVSLNPTPGAAFGVASSSGRNSMFAAVDDVLNSVRLWPLRR